jgi:hypothetical protein
MIVLLLNLFNSITTHHILNDEYIKIYKIFFTVLKMSKIYNTPSGNHPADRNGERMESKAHYQ